MKNLGDQLFLFMSRLFTFALETRKTYFSRLNIEAFFAIMCQVARPLSLMLINAGMEGKQIMVSSFEHYRDKIMHIAMHKTILMSKTYNDLQKRKKVVSCKVQFRAEENHPCQVNRTSFIHFIRFIHGYPLSMYILLHKEPYENEF